MQIIKLNATNSTNEYLKQLLQSNDLEDFSVVVTHNQLNGRGQMGSKWLSESGKNLTFSVLKKGEGLNVVDQFRLNMCVSFAIHNALQVLKIPDLTVKWPNDILSASTKICGILIENILLGSKIQASIIGIGLNVNQTSFGGLPNVSSLKLVKGNNFNLDEVLSLIVDKLKKYLTVEFLLDSKTTSLYESVMFRRNKPSTFKNGKGEFFMGLIKGVSPSGKLIILLEDDIKKEFDLKEVRLLY